MKRVLKQIVIGIFSFALFAATMPAQEGYGYGRNQDRDQARYQAAGWGNNGDNDRNPYSGDRNRDGDRYRASNRDDRDAYRYGTSYRDAYREPSYRGYDDRAGYYGGDNHAGRSVAIVGGSAAAGAVFGAIAGRGPGAAIGAIIGGIGGAIADGAVRHHDRDRW